MNQKDKLPYFDSTSDIVIPFNSDPKYHYWSGGQSLYQTIKELRENKIK